MKIKVDGKEVLNNSTYFPHVIQGEINEEPSLTVPKQSYSVKEVLEKHVRGINLGIYQTPRFDGGDIDSPEVAKLGAVDVTFVEEAKAERSGKLLSQLKTKETVKNSPAEQEDFDGKSEDVADEDAQIHT